MKEMFQQHDDVEIHTNQRVMSCIWRPEWFLFWMNHPGDEFSTTTFPILPDTPWIVKLFDVWPP
jgi:hypothetical protein